MTTGRLTTAPLSPQTVEQVKRILKAQKLYDGPVDGNADARFARSLRRFQERNGLPISGVYDTATDRFLADTFRQLNVSGRPIKGIDDKTLKFIRENYGYMTVYLRHPELGPILAQAAKEGWDEARLQGKLKETKWYRTTPASARQWQRDIYENPADVARRRAEQEAIVRDQANRLGVKITVKRLADIVEHSLMFGWGQELITDALVDESHFRGGRQPIGEINTTMRDIIDMRHRYLLADNPKQAYRFAVQIARGELTIEDVEADFARRAALANPHLADDLKSGTSMADLFDAHRAAIADTLELDPDSVDLTDPRWRDVVAFTDENGKTRSMTVGEASRLARNQPGFRRTDQARADSWELARTITETFGRFQG